jgi:hypothetical protein
LETCGSVHRSAALLIPVNGERKELLFYFFWGLKLNMGESSKTLIDSGAAYGPKDQ